MPEQELIGGLIPVTVQHYRDLKKAYEQALKDKAESFKYLGHDWVPGYIKYALQYMQGKLKIKQHI